MEVTTQSVLQHITRFYPEDQYMPGLHAIHARIAEPAIFWAAFWEVWMLSERHFLDREITAEMMTPERLASPHRTESLNPAERAVLANLPERVRVYRGCWAGNREGWSWTLSETIAQTFANWMPVDGQPLLLTGTVNRRDVLAYLDGREEAEIVADPASVGDRRTRRLPRRKLQAIDHVALLARTGTLAGPEEAEKIRQYLLFTSVESLGIEQFTASCDTMIREATFWNDTAKIAEWRTSRQEGLAFAERLATPTGSRHSTA